MIKYCLTGMLLFSLKVWSQEINPKSIGETIPLIKINTIFNTPALPSNIAFNKGLVILDFMATNCISCLKVLPRFDSIQKIYGDKIKIFLVTNEKKEKIKKFLQNHPSLTLPVIGEDTTLSKYFPHTFISHEVWIMGGVVKAITIPEYVTGDNIKYVLAGNKVTWPVKNDIPDFDYRRSLIAFSTPLFYSAVTGNLKDVPPGFSKTRDSSKKVARISLINYPITELYLMSREVYNFPVSHLVLEVKNRSGFIYDGKMYRDVWMEQHTYCFESQLSLSLSPAARQQIIQDQLDQYFNVRGRFEKRKMQCLVLERTDTLTHPANEKVRTVSLDQLVYNLNHSLYSTPVVDATGYDPNLKIFLPPDYADNIEELKKALGNHGLALKTHQREEEVFVITENTNLF